MFHRSFPYRTSNEMNTCNISLIDIVDTSQSQSHNTTDSQLATPSWCQAPIWDPRPIFISPCDFLYTVAGLLFCSALSDDRTGL
jgi:hypothetical protein